jgi:uncharacterized protein with GYD domain
MILLRYTQQGIEGIKAAPGRVDAARQEFRAMGAELKSFHLLLGAYDAVLFAEIPDEATAAKITLALGALGNVRSETLRAFTEDEYRQIVSELP